MPLDRRGADLVQEQVRERVRQVADEREQPVVRIGVDRDRDGAERRDERVQRAVARRVGRRVRRQEPRRAVEEIGPRALRSAHLGAGDGMAADEALVRDRAREHALRRADVRHRCLRRRGERGLDGRASASSPALRRRRALRTRRRPLPSRPARPPRARPPSSARRRPRPSRARRGPRLPRGQRRRTRRSSPCR